MALPVVVTYTYLYIVFWDQLLVFRLALRLIKLLLSQILTTWLDLDYIYC